MWRLGFAELFVIAIFLLDDGVVCLKKNLVQNEVGCFLLSVLQT